MGKVRPDHVKTMARELVERFPEEFSVDFKRNKEKVDALTDVRSKKLRNTYVYVLEYGETTQKD